MRCGAFHLLAGMMLALLVRGDSSALGQAVRSRLPAVSQPAAATESYELAEFSARASEARRESALDPNVDLATPLADPQEQMPGPVGIGSDWVEGCPDGCCTPESPWLHLGLYGNGFYWVFGGPSYFANLPPFVPPPGGRKTFLQRTTFTTTWLAEGGADGMGVTDLEAKATLALPVFHWSPPLILTPGFGAHLFNGPDVTDVPARTYDSYVDIRWMYQWCRSFATDLAVTPGWYSDWEQSNSDALRVGGRAVGLYTYSPTLQFAFGAVYLDREDVSVLPLGGVIWTPNSEIRYELILPRPKIARRIGWNGCATCNDGTWLYIAGEFGGGSWAIERANGQQDVMNYQDWRAMIGIERTSLAGWTGRIEAGYVFSRQLEYNSGTPDFEPDDTFMLRGEIGF